MVIVIIINQATGEFIYGPDIVTRASCSKMRARNSSTKRRSCSTPWRRQPGSTSRSERGKAGSAESSTEIFQQDHRTQTRDNASDPEMMNLGAGKGTRQSQFGRSGKSCFAQTARCTSGRIMISERKTKLIQEIKGISLERLGSSLISSLLQLGRSLVHTYSTGRKSTIMAAHKAYLADLLFEWRSAWPPCHPDRHASSPTSCSASDWWRN
jgi:hypothetical protein